MSDVAMAETTEETAAEETTEATEATATETAPETTEATESSETTETAETEEASTDDAKSSDWRTLIADEKLRDHARRFNSLDDLVKGNADLRAERDRLRNTAIIKPGKDAGEEEVAAYRKAMGIPDTPDAYEFPEVEGELTDEMKAQREAWGQKFHELGVPNETAKALMQAVRDEAEQAQAAQIEADKRHAEQQTEALKKEWGSDFDANKAYANRAAEQFLGEDFEAIRNLETKDGRFVLDNAPLVKMLARIGREMESKGGYEPFLNDSERESMENQISQLREQQATEQAKGNSQKANELYQREQDLLAKMNGNGSIVGAQGRAA